MRKRDKQRQSHLLLIVQSYPAPKVYQRIELI